jgi:serine phosphatase RsbU (regulator of sigma subunit)
LKNFLFYIISISFLTFISIPVFSNNEVNVDSIVKLLPKKSPDEKIKDLILLIEHFQSDNFEKAIYYGNELIKTVQLSPTKNNVAKSHYVMGTIYYSNADYETALLYLQKAENEYSVLNNELELANCRNTIGSIQEDKGYYDKALDYFLSSLSIFEKYKDSSKIATTYNNIGYLYLDIENYEKSLSYLNKSLEIRLLLKDQLGVAESYNNISNVLSSKGELNEAMELLQKSLAIKEKLGNKKGIAYALNNIGSIYAELGDYKKSIENFEKSYLIKKEINDHRGIIVGLVNIGASYYFSDDLKKANEYFIQAGIEAKKMGVRDLEIDCYNNVIETYNEMGEYQKALEYYDKLIDLKDSVYNSDNSKALMELQTKFDSEKQIKDIEILTQEKELSELELDRQRYFKNAFIIGFAFILILVFVVYNRYQIKHRANAKLEQQKTEITLQHSKLNIAYEEIEAKNKDILDSIKYAKRIQEAILPIQDFENIFGANGFVYYQPKDIVSGDFYWLEKKENTVLLAAVDCTGHGVPGAFMSIVGFNILNQAVNEHHLRAPNLILNELNTGVTNTLRQTEKESSVRDGMDINLCSINYDTLELNYAGAYNPLWIIRNNEFIEIEADKFPIGLFVGQEMGSFKNKSFQLQKGDAIYLFTDGYADQFGGPRGKKFKYQQFKDTLLNIAHLQVMEQKNILEKTILSWKGELEQIDDILVIGIMI